MTKHSPAQRAYGNSVPSAQFCCEPKTALKSLFKNKDTRGLISLQWLRLRAPTAAGTGLIPGQEI